MLFLQHKLEISKKNTEMQQLVNEKGNLFNQISQKDRQINDCTHQIDQLSEMLEKCKKDRPLKKLYFAR
jgi:predicted  nucleic acid-binding Zn-ribbon protein